MNVNFVGHHIAVISSKFLPPFKRPKKSRNLQAVLHYSNLTLQGILNPFWWLIVVVETYLYCESSNLFQKVSHKFSPLNEAIFYIILKIMYFDR